jgi:hypothetical protein
MTNVTTRGKCGLASSSKSLSNHGYAVKMSSHASHLCRLTQWYSTFFVRVPPDTIYLQLCTPKVVGT